MHKDKIDFMSDNFGTEVKKCLIDIKMTQKELAKQLKITETYISLILSGKKFANKMRQQILTILEAEYAKLNSN